MLSSRSLWWQVFIFQLFSSSISPQSAFISLHLFVPVLCVCVSLGLFLTLLCIFCLPSYVFICLCLHLSWLVSSLSLSLSLSLPASLSPCPNPPPQSVFSLEAGQWLEWKTKCHSGPEVSPEGRTLEPVSLECSQHLEPRVLLSLASQGPEWGFSGLAPAFPRSLDVPSKPQLC